MQIQYFMVDEKSFFLILSKTYVILTYSLKHYKLSHFQAITLTVQKTALHILYITT